MQLLIVMCLGVLSLSSPVPQNENNNVFYDQYEKPSSVQAVKFSTTDTPVLYKTEASDGQEDQRECSTTAVEQAASSSSEPDLQLNETDNGDLENERETETTISGMIETVVTYTTINVVDDDDGISGTPKREENEQKPQIITDDSYQYDDDSFEDYLQSSKDLQLKNEIPNKTKVVRGDDFENSVKIFGNERNSENGESVGLTGNANNIIKLESSQSVNQCHLKDNHHLLSIIAKNQLTSKQFFANESFANTESLGGPNNHENYSNTQRHPIEHDHRRIDGFLVLQLYRYNNFHSRKHKEYNFQNNEFVPGVRTYSSPSDEM